MTDPGPAYREQRSRMLPATVWSSVSPGGESTILPDGCMDILWDGDRFLVAGPDTAPYRFTTDGPRTYAAVRFDPGVAPSMLGVRADELCDARPGLDDLWPRHRVERWRDAMLRGGDGTDALEALAARDLDRGPPAWVRPSVRALRAGLPVERTAELVGMSARQLRRCAGEHFGYGPKMLQRILRVQRARSAVDSGQTFSDAAADHGFADQAHFARESRVLLGRSPTALVAKPAQADAGNAA